jgi:hypothetical protein
MASISIPNVPLSATDLVVCLLAIVLAGSLTYLVRAICGTCGRRS